MNDSWFSKLDKVILYMTNNNGKKPPKKEPEIGSWLSDQLGFYRAGSGTAGMWVSKERLQAWTEFMNKNEDQLLTKDEIWDKKLIMLGEFIDLYGRKPSETGDIEEVALLRWSYDQHKRVKPGTDRYEKWNAFMNKYSHLYRTYEESWKDTFDKLVEYVRENNNTPKQNGSTEEECRLARWITRQNMSLSRNELSEEHKMVWEKFNSKGNTVLETIQPIEICIKCKGKDRNGELCRNYPTGENSFCSYHIYLSEYTSEQLQHLQFCKGCNKWKELSEGKNQCMSCGERGKEIRAKLKNEVVLCKSDGCTFKKSDENDYCGKHQLCLFVDECLSEGLTPCSKYLKGCRAKLGSDYVFKSCQECLEKERERDNAKRSAVSDEIVDGKKQCTVCCKFKPVEEYSDTKTCAQCREEFKKQNEKRDKEHVNEIQRIASQKPERKATKKEWEENNYEKVALKTLNYRDKKHNENQDEYLKRNAETMAKWRENNPEKVEESNKSRVCNINYAYQGYNYKCEIKKINFELTKEQFDEIVIKPCYYCEIIQDKGFNGIDRMDSSKGYELDNCVSCCDECNTMKGALDNTTFIRRSEHILTYNNIINSNLHPRAFANHSYINYTAYKKSAKARNYQFDLTQTEFDNIVSYDCYICGKQNSNRHKNGIDRYDNSIGYTSENVRPCCGQCNMMKKDMEYQYFINKLLKIFNYSQKQNYIPVCVPIINTMNRNPNKPSRDEQRKISTEKKQIQRKNMREKYGDEEYKRLHAQKIAEQRRKNKDA
jgi:hypothetical protein